VLPQPVYALAQVAAFYTVPSWKALAEPTRLAEPEPGDPLRTPSS